MALPIQKAPEYFCELPLSGEQVKFRPFLVKEQRNLVLMQEGENEKEMYQALSNLVKAVSFDKLNANDMALADLEYFFLQVRCKSVGETVKLNIPCKVEDCKGVIPYELNLNEVDIDTKEMPDSKLQLSESLGVVLSPPKASVQQKLDSKDEQASFFAILKSCIEQIYDEDNVYDMIDYSETEVDEFVESLTVSQIEMIGEWLQSIPSLKHDIDCKCPVCGTKQRVELKGLENFF
tara:strand:+ start:21727 stop:22431 length:705 start_codon:yes stop_codon:yes gene_type:complete